jgi:putative membrane protein
MMHYWGQPYMRGYGFSGGGIEIVFTVLFWFLIVVLFIGLVKGFHKHKDGHGDFDERSSDSALNILKTRYAKGEINKKEFEEMKKDIS